MKENWPNFLIIGAAKCGTTSLYRYLGAHPDVFMSPYKEPGFFAFDYSAGQEPGLEQLEAYSKCIKTRESYLALFADVDHERAIGEASPQYLSIPGAAARIRRQLPDVRLIALLRHPADRLYSHYQYRCMLNLEPCESFEDALLNSSYDYRRRPTYWVSLEPYYRCFSRDRIHIILYEAFARKTSATVADTFRFLEVDPGFQVDTTHRYYQSRIIRNARLRSRLAKGARVADGLRWVLPRGARSRLRKYSLLLAGVDPPPISPETRRRLAEFYQEDTEKLQDLIGRDLSDWLPKS